LQKRLLILTGNPGIGKTTVLLRIIEALKRDGYTVGGMINREIRSNGTRVGFQILNANSGKSGWLAHVSQKIGPQLGKYRVNLNDLHKVGAEAIINAAQNLDVVAIDEIGPMELFSEKFTAAVKKAVESPKLVISIVHWKARNKIVNETKAREDAQIYIVTAENRETLHKTLIEKAEDILSKTVQK
jgi:nucleoside-triphosphatase